MKDLKKNTKTQPSTGIHTIKETNMKNTNVKEPVKDKESSEVAKDLAEIKETLKKIEQLIATLLNILPYKR